MPVPIAISGTTPDGQATATCTLTFDQERFQAVKDTFGWCLVLPFTFKGSVTVTNPTATIYYGGTCELLCLSGWVGMSGSPWVKGLPATYVLHGQEWGSLALPLTDRDIEAIEDRRAGADAQFNVSLSGLARVTAGARLFASIGGPGTPKREFALASVITLGADAFPQRGTTHFLQIDRERWLRFLTSLGRQSFLFELPVMETRHDGAWKEAARTLERAAQFQGQGDFEEVPEKCREVLEGILRILADQWGIGRPGPNNFESWAKEVARRLKDRWPEGDKDQADTIALLLNAGRLWSRASHHFGTGVPKRREAAFILHLTSTVFELAVQLAEAFPDLVVPPS